MKVRWSVVLLLSLVPASLLAQGTPLAGDNPLAELKAEVTRVLAEAKLPFTDEQDRAIALMMEERRQASEGLFGNLMDFRAGPTQRQEEERLRSAIEWLRTEFIAQLQNHLTPEQLVVWNRFQQARDQISANGRDAGRPNLGRQQQTQYVRINNNAFTAEDAQYRNQGGFGFGNNNQNNNNNNNHNNGGNDGHGHGDVCDFPPGEVVPEPGTLVGAVLGITFLALRLRTRRDAVTSPAPSCTHPE